MRPRRLLKGPHSEEGRKEMPMRRTLLVLMVLLAGVGLAVAVCGWLPVVAGPIVAAQGGPAISTDKAVYAPGETVHISGSGFGPGASLTIRVTRPDGSVVSGDGSLAPWPTAYDTVVADAEGSLQLNYVLAGMDGAYVVEAVDGEGTTLATCTFTDPAADTTLTLTLASSPACAGASVVATATLTKTSDGKPVNGKSIDFKLGANPLGSDSTDTNGIAQITFTASVSGTVTATWAGDGGYKTSSDTASLTVNPLPVAPTSASVDRNNFCADDAATISLTASGGSGTTLAWYTGSCGGTAAGTGTPLVIASPTSTTTYYARWENTCGASSCASVTVTVNALPVATAGNNGPVCEGQTLTLTGGPSGMTSYAWTGPNAYTSSEQSPTVALSATLAMAGDYALTVTNSSGCEDSASTSVTVNALPVAPASASATPATICAGQSTTLAASGGSGTTLHWYTGSCGGTSVGTGSNLSVSPTTSTTTYYARWENTCGNSTCESVTVTVKPLAVAPTSAGVDRDNFRADDAGTITLTAVGGSGDTLRWYTRSCGGTAAGTGTPLEIASPETTTTYYARWENTCGASSCASVTVTVKTYTITASAGTGGTISPSGAVSVDGGASKTFTMTAATGYHVADVLVDGLSMGAVTSFTFTNVATAHTISARFAVNGMRAIVAIAGYHGTITPSGVVVVQNGVNRTFTITPAAHYHVADVLVDWASVGAVTSYTFTNVTANHRIVASFAADTNTITATAGAHGAISPSGPVAVNYNTGRAFTITPALHYHVLDVKVDGASVGAVRSYTFRNVVAAHTISATFTIDQNTITATAGAHGAISPSGPVLVNYGASQTFTITPAANYHVVAVFVDKKSVGAVTAYTFTNVTGAHTISVMFAVNVP